MPKRQQVMKELEKTWWDMWIVQVLPHLVPYKKWRVETRSVKVGDIVLVLFDRKIGKGDYRLARVLRVHLDTHKPPLTPHQQSLRGDSHDRAGSQSVVRTVTVGMRQRDRRETSLPYIPRPLQELTIGVQRLAVICPIEEQVDTDDGLDLGVTETKTNDT